MRELNIDEIELVFGGYKSGVDGPSVDGLGIVGATSANGVVLGGAAGLATGAQLGISGIALIQGVSASALLGGVYGGAFGVGIVAGTTFNQVYERTTGMSVGESIYRAFN